MSFRYLALFLVILTVISCKKEEATYVCRPCNLACDDLTFSEPGTCPHCNMELIEKSALAINIQSGSGYFQMKGGNGDQDKAITVFYHKPENFSPESRILLVIPGAGRNGDSYRDAWIEESEKHSVLILSPMYPERMYGFEDYHLGGLITDTNLESSVEYVENTNIARLDEEKFDFKVNPNSKEWIFNDFDRIVDSAMTVLNFPQTSYDLFGHSAGGHLLHRFALFGNSERAETILAANASFYTLPTFAYAFPFGLQNTSVEQAALQGMFEKRLVLLLGELDNANETGGTFLRSKTADEQGLHRLARGKFFFAQAKAMADSLGFEFNWQLKIVPEVGHNHQLMGNAAGEYLYEKD